MYIYVRKIPNFTKKAQVSDHECASYNLNDLYIAHHNLLGIRRQLKIRHLYGTFIFTTQCICMGTGSLLVYRFCCIRGKARPLRRKMVFAVVRIVINKLDLHLDHDCYFAVFNELLGDTILIDTLEEAKAYRHKVSGYGYLVKYLNLKMCQISSHTFNLQNLLYIQNNCLHQCHSFLTLCIR